MSGRRISGYAAVFDAPDAQADAIDAGAFRATLRARGHRLPLLWQHAMAEPLGHVVAAREDEHGLWFEAALAPTRRAADALALIERSLIEAGSDKTKLLQATVYVTEISRKAEMDEVWNEWIGPDNWPQRACIGVDLAPGDLVEIVVIASR